MGWSEDTVLADPVETLPVTYLETPEETEADRTAAAEPLDTEDGDYFDEPVAPTPKRRRRGKKDEVDEADIPPEVLARRKKKALQAKLIIYGTIGALTLAFLLLLAERLPRFFPDSFPKGLPPWNIVFPEWYTPRERPHQLPDGSLFYPGALQTRIEAAQESLEKARTYFSEAQDMHRGEDPVDEARIREIWQRVQSARAHLAQVEEMTTIDRGLPNVDMLLGDLRGLENRVIRFEGQVRNDATAMGVGDLPTFDPLPPIPGQSVPRPDADN